MKVDAGISEQMKTLESQKIPADVKCNVNHNKLLVKAEIADLFSTARAACVQTQILWVAFLRFRTKNHDMVQGLFQQLDIIQLIAEQVPDEIGESYAARGSKGPYHFAGQLNMI